MKKILFFFTLIIFLSSILNAQNGLTGNLKQDSRIAFAETKELLPLYSAPVQNKKSPMLAGVLSLFIPGAGEVYAGEYLKAAIFVAVEAAFITTAVIYDNKGDDKTTEFEGYADQEWSVVKYAEWLNEYRDGSINISPDQNLKPWERVNWDELNSAESGFSHKLPPYGDQQYYELIGKYPQYSPGWREFDPADGDYHNVPPQFMFYSGMRGKANDYYNVATKAVIGIYINHFLSALDAVWSTAQYNKQLAVSVRAENVRFADINELIPVINLKYSF
jgi:TM2 domain-containing membrane protein YozV